MLQAHGDEMGVTVELTPKFHAEMAGGLGDFQKVRTDELLLEKSGTIIHLKRCAITALVRMKG